MRRVAVGLGIALVLLVVAAATAWLVGRSLPVEHRATTSARVAASPGATWDAINDVDAFPSWRPDVSAVERLPDVGGLPAWRERGRGGALVFEMEEREPPGRLVIRVRDPGGAFGGTWTYRVEPDGDGARVTLTEDGQVYAPIFRFASRYVIGHDRTMRAWLSALQDHLGAPSGDAGRVGGGA